MYHVRISRGNHGNHVVNNLTNRRAKLLKYLDQRRKSVNDVAEKWANSRVSGGECGGTRHGRSPLYYGPCLEWAVPSASLLVVMARQTTPSHIEECATAIIIISSTAAAAYGYLMSIQLTAAVREGRQWTRGTLDRDF